MVNDEILDLGSSVIVNANKQEELIPALGDGSAKAGDLCYIQSTNGKVAGTDVGAAELFSGIMLEHPKYGTETAIPDGVQCTLVVPESGERYRIRCLDLGADKQLGFGLDFSATAYKADGAADIIHSICYVSKLYTNTETVVEVRWA